MVQIHQTGQAVFRSIRPEDIDWRPFSAFPPSVRLAVVVGHPLRTWPLSDQGQGAAWRETDADGHPEDRIDTVMSGVFYIGLGDRFDGSRVKAYPPGSVVILPGTPHFHWAKSGEYVTQVTAIGPLGIE